MVVVGNNKTLKGRDTDEILSEKTCSRTSITVCWFRCNLKYYSRKDVIMFYDRIYQTISFGGNILWMPRSCLQTVLYIL